MSRSCHRGLPSGNFGMATTRCESCHQQQYLDARTPDHVAFGFPTNCDQCHQMNRWKPASMPDHDALFFPVFSGVHQNTWSDCSTCHPSATNKKQFTCLSCHEHGQAKMNSKHQGITGYAYNSQDCYQCHPTGQKAEFRAHDAQFFPIFSGKHKNKWDACKTCHIDPNNRKVFSCVECHEHRQAKMDPKHQGIPGYAFNSLNCYQCHPTGQKAEFREHDAQFFPIFSGTHQNKWDACKTCHVDPNNRKVFSCVECHEHNQNLMDSKHQGITGYSVSTVMDCYQCHPTGQKREFREHDAQFFPIFPERIKTNGTSAKPATSIRTTARCFHASSATNTTRT
ncbi:MAG: hypothetical protein Q9P14_00725 [candidate division KSB1 bacterium]|nr:hypothetical protein [candidate division KSB1 bacterium]